MAPTRALMKDPYLLLGERPGRSAVRREAAEVDQSEDPRNRLQLAGVVGRLKQPTYSSKPLEPRVPLRAPFKGDIGPCWQHLGHHKNR